MSQMSQMSTLTGKLQGKVNTWRGRVPPSSFRKQAEARTPLGRIGVPQDIAPAAVFLASADAVWITGETLHVTGGVR
jgi:NAD(P)-dependent dehydrogenase (short-subunit alcohol dehydrogenase family)